ncbi:hypothetical protein STCU_11878 [Strigomonas culicis]|uniref:Uncharacterized protein n=1 Tax=Strigomonas culicis TaxID=28005 RepID=S9UYP1_9TRYP|nr:hypothetical protein STCU_11878 [Strigomonas culicis]|eukprot:EPY15630.1 hypothetical protein STCU_11878 [Strigomonas culicis]
MFCLFYLCFFSVDRSIPRVALSCHYACDIGDNCLVFLSVLFRIDALALLPHLLYIDCNVRIKQFLRCSHRHFFFVF